MKFNYGITEFKPLLVNPSQQELETFYNRELKRAPKYLFKEGTMMKMELYGELPQAKNYKTKMVFWLENVTNVTKTGKTQYINGQGIASYSDKMNKPGIYNNFRPAKKGEAILAEFMSVLTPWKKNLEKFAKGEFPNNFIDVDKIFSEDYSDIQKVLKKGNSVMAYIGAVGDTYLESEVYSKKVLSTMTGNLNPIIDALSNPYTSFYKNMAPIQEQLVFGEVEIVKEEPKEDYNQLPF
jgi:hypothetical protein